MRFSSVVSGVAASLMIAVVGVTPAAAHVSHSHAAGAVRRAGAHATRTEQDRNGAAAHLAHREARRRHAAPAQDPHTSSTATASTSTSSATTPAPLPTATATTPASPVSTAAATVSSAASTVGATTTATATAASSAAAPVTTTASAGTSSAGTGLGSCGTLSSPGAVSGSWTSNFDSGDFSQWTWWGQGQASIWGDISVVNPASVGIPACDPSDPHVAQMTVPADGPSDGQVNAKLYKYFDTVGSDGVERSPSDVSGTYSASYYIPSSYQVPDNDWANIFQFKERYPDANGESQSDPLWWVQLANGAWAKTYSTATWLTPKPTSPNQPVAMLNYWGNNWTRQVVFYTVPLDQWFQISAVVDQDNSIAFYINGQLFDTALQSQYHTGPFHADSQAWFFGAGNYATAPNTTLYLGGASYTPAAS